VWKIFYRRVFVYHARKKNRLSVLFPPECLGGRLNKKRAKKKKVLLVATWDWGAVGGGYCALRVYFHDG